MTVETVAWGLCGSFCTFEKALRAMEALRAQGTRVLPVMSFAAAGTDTRFGAAAQWKARLAAVCGCRPVETLAGAEPLGPKNLAGAMVIAPCTGATLARLAAGASDTPVTLAAKSLLRNARPVVLAVSTNDGLAASFENLAKLLNRKNYYIVPFAQDDWLKKPFSLQSDFDLIGDTLACALAGRQLQPVLEG